MKVFSINTLGCLLTVFASCSSQAQTLEKNTTSDGSLNLLLLMTDQHRGDSLGAAGAAWVRTPNLDRLAKEGILFRRGYASIPSCIPARTSLLTGRSPWGHGLLGYVQVPEYGIEMAKSLTAAGFRTHAAGKNHFAPMRNKHGYQTVELEEDWYSWKQGTHAFDPKKRKLPLDPKRKCDYTLWFENEMPGKNLNASGLGYTDHRGGHPFPYEERLHPTNWTADRAVDFLKRHKIGEKWFLKVSFQRPHPPFDAPRRFLDYYAANPDIPMPVVADWAEKWFGHKNGSLEKTPKASSGVFPENEIRLSRYAYYSMINHVDEQIGRVMKALKERGELENTLIIYCYDHGDMMGDHHMWRKCRAYEGSARVPFILRWPKSMGWENKRGQVRQELVELRDIFPTFLDAAGLPKPAVVDGLSMLDVLRGKKWRTILDLEHSRIYEHDNAWIALTDERYKYIYFHHTGKHQLFDLTNDPTEMFNLCEDGKNAKLVASWRQKMIQHLDVRGEKWVKDGKLQIHKKAITFGDNHPSRKKKGRK
jgi:arylsulfatase A-like enzyme